MTLSDPASCMLVRNHDIVEQPVRMGTYVNRITAEAIHFLESSMMCSRHRCRERKSFAITIGKYKSDAVSKCSCNNRWQSFYKFIFLLLSSL